MRRYRLAILILTAISPAHAQTSTGEIDFTVVDPSHAVIPNAQITITGAETGNIVRTLLTNDRGIATAPLLKPDTYNIVVSAPGFNKCTRYRRCRAPGFDRPCRSGRTPSRR